MKIPRLTVMRAARCRLSLSLLCTSLLFVGHGQSYVRLEGRDFTVDGNRFFLKMINYFNVSVISDSYGSTDANHLFLAPSRGFDETVDYECNSLSTCNTQLHNHLKKIGSTDADPMGYNSIRLWGLAPSLCVDAYGTLTMAYPVEQFNASGQYQATYWVHLQGPDFVDQNSINYFNLLHNYLQICESENIRVMLLASMDRSDGNPPDGYAISPVSTSEAKLYYADYLHRLAGELANEPMLFAYDLWNEPGAGSNNSNLNQPKSAICDATAIWYDAIRSAAPYQYVTIGATCQTGDLRAWDPSAMKIDFYSPHLYPSPSAADGYSFVKTMNRVKAEMYWFGLMSPMPVVIGETGFTAEDEPVAPLDLVVNHPNWHLDANSAHHVMPYMNGSEAQQAAYAVGTLTYSPSCLISGWAWWGFQNDYRYDLNSTSEDYGSNFFGPLHYGNPAGLGVAPFYDAHSWRNKAMVAPVRDVLLPALPSTLGSPPLHYHDWSYFGTPQIYEFTFLDQYERPIRELVCDVTHGFQATNNDDGPHYTFRSKFTPDNNGHLVIHSYPYDTDEYYAIFHELDINIIGGPTLRWGNGPNPVYSPIPASGSVIHVNRDYFGFDWTEDEVEVGLGEFRDLRGWHSLTVSDLQVDGATSAGGEVWAHARTDVQLAGESHIAYGSEAHLWNEPTFGDCTAPELDGMQLDSQTRGLGMQGQGKSPRRFLRFDATSGKSCVIGIGPNPVDGILVIQCAEAGSAFSVQTVAGLIVEQGILRSPQSRLNTAGWTPGAYILTIQCPAGLERITVLKP